MQDEWGSNLNVLLVSHGGVVGWVNKKNDGAVDEHKNNRRGFETMPTITRLSLSSIAMSLILDLQRYLSNLERTSFENGLQKI